MSTFKHLIHDLSYAGRRYFRLHKQRDEATWARFAITSAFGIGFPSLFMALGVLFGGMRVNHVDVLVSYGCGFLIAFMIHGGYRLTEVLLSQASVDRLNQGGWRAGVFFTAMPIGCVALGMWICAQLLSWWTQAQVLSPFDDLRGISQFLFISLIGALIGWYLDHQNRRRQALQLQATEAQLLRLQAQIEPHFLFNSLAAVQSLIKPAPDRALDMLEQFTDYLRASLDTLRHETCPLSTELQVVRSYLGLMKIRMDERLSYEITVSPEAEGALLPPLLLQPLVENAILHGLEDKLDGGTVKVHASCEEGQLVVRVLDDGLGLQSRRGKRAGSPAGTPSGNGLALNNIRQRLQTRYEHRAQLTVTPSHQGCVSEIRLPWVTSQPPKH